MEDEEGDEITILNEHESWSVRILSLAVYHIRDPDRPQPLQNRIVDDLSWIKSPTSLLRIL